MCRVVGVGGGVQQANAKWCPCDTGRLAAGGEVERSQCKLSKLSAGPRQKHYKLTSTTISESASSESPPGSSQAASGEEASMV